MKFTIITPSLMRGSLLACCESVDGQTYEDWEHIIMMDGVEIKPEFLTYDHLRREVFEDSKHGHYGNHARWLAWERATGDYIIYLDDDNTMFSPDSLQNIAECLKDNLFPDWAIFPIHRHGSVFFHIPPGLCMTDTANVVAKREIGRWPDIEAREADGHFVEYLKANHPFATAFPNCPPIILMERSSNGE